MIRSWILWLLALNLMISAGIAPATASAQTHPQQPAQGPIQGGSPLITLVSSTDSETQLLLRLPDYAVEVRQGLDGACQQIQIPGFGLGGEPGQPSLPRAGTMLGVPAQGSLHLSVVRSQGEPVTGLTHPCPAPDVTMQEDESGTPMAVEVPTRLAWNPAQHPPLATVTELGFFRSQRLARVEFTPVQMDPQSGQVTLYREVLVQISHPEGAAARSIPAQAMEEPLRSEELLQASLLNYESARSWRDPGAGQTGRAGLADAQAWTLPSPAYRVRVTGAGLYQITYDELAEAGFNPSQVNPQRIQLLHNGEAVAIAVVNGNNQAIASSTLQPDHRLLFYHPGLRDKYAVHDVYWLTVGQSMGQRMVEKNNSGSDNNTFTTYRHTDRVEQNLNYISTTPLTPGAEHWYGLRFQVFGYNQNQTRNFRLNLSNLAEGAGSATLRIALVSVTRNDHFAEIYVNGELVAESQWRTARNHLIEASFDQSLLREGDNQVSIRILTQATGTISAVVYKDWMELDYARNLRPLNDRMIFENPEGGNWSYPIPDFSSSDIEVFDITNPQRVIRILGLAANNRVRFGNLSNEASRYLVQTQAKRLSPAGIEAVSPEQDLLSPQNQADYVIISHAKFMQAMQPLVNFRQQQGMRVHLVDVQQVYDQFSYGRVSVEAIRDFLAYAYANWQSPKLEYVLLVGDGTYDPKGYLSTSAATYIPPYLEMVDPLLGETAADNRFVTIHGDDMIPDLFLGRFPVNTVEEATIMVNKTIAYETQEIVGEWNRNVLFVTDNLDGGGGAFYNFSDAIAQGMGRDGQTPLLPEAYERPRLYLDRTCTLATCSQGIIDQINQGSLLVSYVGHGTKQFWASEQLLTISSIQQMTNSDRLTIMLPMTCLEGFFHQPETGFSALGEAIVRSPNGAVASWTATGLGLVTGHDYLERGFFLGLFHDGIDRMGPLTVFGKIHLAENAPANLYRDLLDTYLLFGDPALRVRTLESEPAQQTMQLFLPSVQR
jgi:hypothetical protein